MSIYHGDREEDDDSASASAAAASAAAAAAAADWRDDTGLVSWRQKGMSCALLAASLAEHVSFE